MTPATRAPGSLLARIAVPGSDSSRRQLRFSIGEALFFIVGFIGLMVTGGWPWWIIGGGLILTAYGPLFVRSVRHLRRRTA
jgi:hypothetical protein